MSNFHLPVDLLFDLLARLPVKVLLRFRCISKSWTALIDSAEFIKIQLNQSLMDSKSHKVILEIVEGSKSRPSFKLFAGNFNSRENFISSAEELYYPEPDREQGRKLIGSCNGLLCIRYVKDGLFLCNPWTRKHKKLPNSLVEIEFSQGRNWIYTLYGFGYDDVSDDYKVVRLVGVREKFSGKFCKEVKIYSLKSSSWRRIEDLPHAIPRHERASGVLANCALHWMLTDVESILAIDLRTEERRLLPPPGGFEWRTSNLGVSNGCLCMWRCVGVQDLMYVKICLMKDYGIKDSWINLTLQIGSLPYPRLSFVGYSESEKLLIGFDSYELLWYDTGKKLLQKIEAGVCGRVKNFCYSVASLVQPCSAVRRGRRSKRKDLIEPMNTRPGKRALFCSSQ